MRRAGHGYRTGLGEVIAVPGALEEDGYPTVGSVPAIPVSTSSATTMRLQVFSGRSGSRPRRSPLTWLRA